MLTQAIFDQTDIAYLQDIAKSYPELAWMATPSAASPEGRQSLRPDSYARQVFPDIADTAIEMERTLSALLCLKWVWTGDYTLFISAQKNASDRLSQKSFNELREWTTSALAQAEYLDICLYAIACNDLGKLDMFNKLLPHAEDHDILLAELTAQKPELFPTYATAFSESQREIYLGGLKAHFNLWQLVQAENLPSHLTGIREANPKAKTLRLLCEVYDFCGAHGHIVGNGSATMTDNMYQLMKIALRDDNFNTDQQTYDSYLRQYLSFLGVDDAIDTAEQRSIARLIAQARTTNTDAARKIRDIFMALPETVRTALTQGLSPQPQHAATMIYYAPALIASSVAAYGFDKGIKMAFEYFADLFKSDNGSGNTIDVSAEARRLKRLSCTSVSIPGDRVAFIGIGGGSDSIQAALLAIISGKKACAISLRTQKPTSQNGVGKTDESRRVENHGGMVTDGVYLMTPETRGSGRFLEFLTASLLPTYLVIDQGDDLLSDKINAAILHFGGVDTIVAVDTGGDCLYRTQVSDSEKATPDQDIRSLHAIAGIKAQNLISCVIANGIDAPDDAADVLASADAKYYKLNEEETHIVLNLYRQFHMDGSDPTRYGKTPFAWQAALKGLRGRTRIPLPDSVVNDPENPWNPYVEITDEMAGYWLIDLKKHLKAIS